MVALIIGVLLIAFCVFACLPAGMGLGWSADVINFLKGFAPFIAAFIGRVSKGNLKLMVAIIIIISSFASALIDNIPFAATMVPVIKSLAATQGVDLSVLAWALSMGTDVGGSATPIGASANVVGTSVAAKNGYMIGWGKYCRTAVPATIIVVLISMVCIFVRYC